MNRIAFLILAILKAEEAESPAGAMSAYEIVDAGALACRPDTVYKKLSELKKEAYVDAGFKDGRANTYYITKKGVLILEDARKSG